MPAADAIGRERWIRNRRYVPLKHETERSIGMKKTFTESGFEDLIICSVKRMSIRAKKENC